MCTRTHTHTLGARDHINRANARVFAGSPSPSPSRVAVAGRVELFVHACRFPHAYVGCFIRFVL